VRHETASLRVLRSAGGPLTTREVTGRTAREMGCTMKYADVHGVLRAHAVDGDVLVDEADDWRDDRWEAVA
jgi:hypothetical protein